MEAGTTRAELEAITAQVNELLEARGAAARLFVQARNGYIALDRVRPDGSMCDHLRAGTKAEIATYVRAMAAGIWLAEEKA